MSALSGISLPAGDRTRCVNFSDELQQSLSSYLEWARPALLGACSDNDVLLLNRRGKPITR